MLNPLDVLLWTLRRNERDVIRLYDSLYPVMQLATGATMLNFGYWTGNIAEPVPAQENLCGKLAELAEMDGAKMAADLGSGLSAPAILWQSMFQSLKICCINTGYSQLSHAGPQRNIEFLNATSTKLPLRDGAADRVLALESSQHFRPYADFVAESHRVLDPSGILALALPVVTGTPSISRLGVLKFTWSSEHYLLDDVRSMLLAGGFEIASEELIGSSVYEPLADFYARNRRELKESITSRYPGYVEGILYDSLRRMKRASEERVIDYALFKCMPRRAGRSR